MTPQPSPNLWPAWPNRTQASMDEIQDRSETLVDTYARRVVEHGARDSMIMSLKEMAND